MAPSPSDLTRNITYVATYTHTFDVAGDADAASEPVYGINGGSENMTQVGCIMCSC